MLKTKINLPIDSGGDYPNVNNKSGEATKISELIQNLQRTNTGQVQWTSPTSGIVYNTSSSQDVNINNKGETGLYNLLIEKYSGENGFMLSANDFNDVQQRIDETFNPLIDKVKQLSNKQDQSAIKNDISINQMMNSNNDFYDELISYYSNMDKAKYFEIEYNLGDSKQTSEINCGVQWTYDVPSNIFNFQTQNFEVVGYMWRGRDETKWRWGKQAGVCSVVKNGLDKISYISCYMAKDSTTGNSTEGYVDMHDTSPFGGRLKVLIRVASN